MQRDVDAEQMLGYSVVLGIGLSGVANKTGLQILLLARSSGRRRRWGWEAGELGTGNSGRRSRKVTRSDQTTLPEIQSTPTHRHPN